MRQSFECCHCKTKWLHYIIVKGLTGWKVSLCYFRRIRFRNGVEVKVGQLQMQSKVTTTMDWAMDFDTTFICRVHKGA